MRGRWIAFQEVDNKDGRYICDYCGEALISVTWYRHPRLDLKVEMHGTCVNKRCRLFHKLQRIV